MVSSKIAYIDEFGDSGLDFSKSRTSSHFIVTAIIFDQNNIEKAEEIMTNIRQRFFQGSEIKSKKVANNDNRRKLILEEMRKMDFSIFAVVVDKSRLYTDGGFRFHGSFYKFIHSLVHRELYKAFPNLNIIADEHGGNHFMQQFIEYVRENQINPDLFNESSFRFVDSNSKGLVQIADFICGTIAKRYDHIVKSDNAREFFELLSDKLIPIKEWPSTYLEYTYNPKEYSEFDKIISEYCLRVADLFISKYKSSNEEQTLKQVACLQYMVFYFKNISPNKYIPTKDLMTRIRITSNSPLAVQQFRSSIIAKLRDAGVIIASSNEGYKIPMNSKDIYDFVNRGNGVIVPLLSRISKARNQILLATNNSLDILDREEYKQIASMNMNNKLLN